jgi:hypothetical protein
LQSGLVPGDQVTILDFDCGYYTVEKAGRTFTVFLANIA